MTVKLHDALTEALDSLKEAGLIRKYSLVWSGRSEAPRIIVWKALDASDEEQLRCAFAGRSRSRIADHCRKELK
jgi:hypothetical protein